jgi:glutamine synthetase
MERDSYDLNPEEQRRMRPIPKSLEEALEALAADHDFLLQGGVFTSDVISTWIEYKLKREIEAIKYRPHPYEFCLYYDL